MININNYISTLSLTLNGDTLVIPENVYNVLCEGFPETKNCDWKGIDRLVHDRTGALKFCFTYAKAIVFYWNEETQQYE